MKAFAALHYMPEREADYAGYKRIEFDYVDNLFLKPVGITFDAVGEDVSGLLHAAVYDAETGGNLLCATPLTEPGLSAKNGEKLLVILFCNLPETLTPGTRAMFHAWITQEIKAEDIPVKVYEAVNDELAAHGIPVIPCIRQGAAHWVGKISMMPSLREHFDTPGEAEK